MTCLLLKLSPKHQIAPPIIATGWNGGKSRMTFTMKPTIQMATHISHWKKSPSPVYLFAYFVQSIFLLKKKEEAKQEKLCLTSNFFRGTKLDPKNKIATPAKAKPTTRSLCQKEKRILIKDINAIFCCDSSRSKFWLIMYHFTISKNKINVQQNFFCRLNFWSKIATNRTSEFTTAQKSFTRSIQSLDEPMIKIAIDSAGFSIIDFLFFNFVPFLLQLI